MFDIEYKHNVYEINKQKIDGYYKGLLYVLSNGIGPMTADEILDSLAKILKTAHKINKIVADLTKGDIDYNITINISFNSLFIGVEIPMNLSPLTLSKSYHYYTTSMQFDFLTIQRAYDLENMVKLRLQQMLSSLILRLME